MFKSIISLGYYCGVASSMSKYGLRSFSGPFDWWFSDLCSVVHFIETDFLDFLCKENLAVENSSLLDLKYNMSTSHEECKDFENSFLLMRKKYLRRIANFQYATKQPTLFIRAVRDREELEYIAGNSDYILRAISRNNSANKIIYLIPRFLEIPHNFNQSYYDLNIYTYQGNYRSGLRGLFDTNKDFIEFCKNNYSKQEQIDNINFDLKKQGALPQAKVLSIEQQAIKDIDQAYMSIYILTKFLETDFSKIKFSKKIDIYGAGKIGKLFYNKIKEYISVGCFIDKFSREQSYDNIPIVQLENYNFCHDNQIVVTSIYYYNEICNDLITYKNINEHDILSLKEILGNLQ